MMRILLRACLCAAAMVLCLAPARAQNQADSGSAAQYYQSYVNRLIEDWRLEQVRDFARQWGLNVSGGREFGINRSFWEERFNLSLSIGLPRGRPGQNLLLEYQLRPKLLIRGEASRQPARNEAWLDLIFRSEY